MGQKGVEERVPLSKVSEGIQRVNINLTHANSGPHEPDEHCVETEFFGTEKGRDALRGELFCLSFDDLDSRECLATNFLDLAADLVEDLFREPGFGVVVVCNTPD